MQFLTVLRRRCSSFTSKRAAAATATLAAAEAAWTVATWACCCCCCLCLVLSYLSCLLFSLPLPLDRRTVAPFDFFEPNEIIEWFKWEYEREFKWNLWNVRSAATFRYSLICCWSQHLFSWPNKTSQHNKPIVTSKLNFNVVRKIQKLIENFQMFK